MKNLIFSSYKGATYTGGLYLSEIYISSIIGNSQKLDGGAMFGNVPRPVWSQWYEPDSVGRINLATRAMLIETGPFKVLCETGVGAFFEPKLAERFGIQEKEHVLLNNLENHGLSHQDITHVILSHLHFDHAGGLLPSWSDQQTGSDDLLFPNANFLVSAAAWERMLQPHARDRASFISSLKEKLEGSGRLNIICGKYPEDELRDFISFDYSEGHTPGQMMTRVKGKNKCIIFVADLIPGAHWIHLPITMGYDRYPELIIDEKRELYKTLENKDLIFFTHDTMYAISGVQLNTKGKYEAVNPQKSILRLAI